LKNKSNADIEEIKWYQRAKSQFILDGDVNTRYFHSVANGRYRKKLIHSLIQDEGIIEGHKNFKSYITNYYKGLFGYPEEGTFSMDETQTNDISQVSVEENNFLTSLYTEEEVRNVVFQMEHNKAAGPDGFLAEFYQNFWEVIKSDLLELFTFLHARQLELFRLNFGEIIYYLRLMKQKGSNSEGLSAFLMLVLKVSLSRHNQA
jgi:mannosylglycoprotein endo-beta-mannosidase